MSVLTPHRSPATMPERAPRSTGFGPRQLVVAVPGALRKLDPRELWRNPVMLIVEVGAALTTALAIATPFLGEPSETASSSAA